MSRPLLNKLTATQRPQILRPIFVATITLASMISGCTKSPTVTSAESQELILRFYTACNTRNSERLETAIRIYLELIESNQVSIQEQKHFDELIELARKNHWETAEDKAYAFSQAQVR